MTEPAQPHRRVDRDRVVRPRASTRLRDRGPRRRGELHEVGRVRPRVVGEGAGVGVLIHQARPDLDADLLAHLLLAPLTADLQAHLAATGLDLDRRARAVADLVGALLR